MSKKKKIDGRGRPNKFDEKQEKRFASLVKEFGTANAAWEHITKKLKIHISVPTLIKIARKHGVKIQGRGRPKGT